MDDQWEAFKQRARSLTEEEFLDVFEGTPFASAYQIGQMNVDVALEALEEVQESGGELTRVAFVRAMAGKPYNMRCKLGKFIYQQNPYFGPGEMKLLNSNLNDDVRSGVFKDRDATNPWKPTDPSRVPSVIPHPRDPSSETWYFTVDKRPNEVDLADVTDIGPTYRNVVKAIELTYGPAFDDGSGTNAKPPHIVIAFAGGNGS